MKKNNFIDFNGNYKTIIGGNYDTINRKDKIDFIDINICGVRYSLLKNQMRKFPGSVLARLSYVRIFGDVCEDELPEGVEWNSSLNEFTIRRTPRLFDIILQYYINGKLHVPKWACKEEVSDELAFWDLTASIACKKCCGKSILCDSDGDDDDDGDQQYSKMLINRRRRTYFQMFTKWGSMKRNMRHFLEQPKTSFGAKIYAAAFIFMIFLSVLNFAIGTVDELQFCPNITSSDEQNITIISSSTNETFVVKPFTTAVMQDYFDVNGENFFSTCDGTKLFQAVDLFCLVFFTIDLILRIVSCQQLVTFFSSPLRTIELIVVLPYYIELILWSQQVTVSESRTLFFILRLFQTIRILNVIKLARYLDDLKILGIALKSSKREMCMLLLFVFVAVFLSSSIVYQFESSQKEDNPFNSLISCCWWGIVTLATVGYGDMVPVTVGGKIAASFVCVLGILVVAFPMAVLVEHFRNAYEKNKKNKNLTLMLKATKQKDVEKRKNSMSKMNEIHLRINKSNRNEINFCTVEHRK